jgi:hypothetical protein
MMAPNAYIVLMPALPYCVKFSDGYLILGVRMHDVLPVTPVTHHSRAFVLLDALLAKWNFSTCLVGEHQHARWLLPEDAACHVMGRSKYQFLVYQNPNDVKG